MGSLRGREEDGGWLYREEFEVVQSRQTVQLGAKLNDVGGKIARVHGNPRQNLGDGLQEFFGDASHDALRDGLGNADVL
jgi:hypothetical protein